MPHFTNRVLATTVASALALLVAAVARVTVLPQADAATAMPGTGIIKLGSSFSQASGADRYGMIIVGRADASAAAAQPGRSLIYQSGASVNTEWDAGVPYTVAVANNWLLRDGAGALLRNVNFPTNYIGDVGSTSYQNEWARRVGDYLASVGADGVFIDDVVADAPPLMGSYPANYPNRSAWESAMASFVAAVGSQLKSRGFYVAVNAVKWVAGDPGSDNGTLTAEWWRTLGPNVSGLMTEYWMQNPVNLDQRRAEGPEWYNNWSGWSALVDVAEGMGRDFLGLTQASSAGAEQMAYGMGSFLLRWDGGGSAMVAAVSGGDPWSPQWAAEMGLPTGGRYAVGVGWRRDFTGGTVVVNPSSSTSQSFSLGAAYLRPDGTSVTSVTLAPATAMILRGSGAPSAPVNTALPSITGATQQGVVLSATSGAWSGSPTSFAYQWNRCDSAGANCAAISGATGTQFSLGVSDLGKTLRVKVTASNAGGSTAATSNATTAVVPPAPANLTLPAISGTAQDGKSLSASTGTWTNSPTSYAYQWQRCDSGGNACGAVTSATGASFALTSADVGKSLRVVVTASNVNGSATATSPASPIVAAASGGSTAAPVNTVLPGINGTTQSGRTLTASPGSWSNAPTSYAYQWRRCDTAGASCAAISGATASDYLLVIADVGHTIRASVTAANSAGSATATSTGTGIVSPPASSLAAPVNTSLPVVTGTPQDGDSLSASTGSWSNSPTSYAYKWRRCDSGGGGCADVGGATGSQYAPTSADVGNVLRVVVTATNAAGSASATSAATAIVSPAPVAAPKVVAPTSAAQPNVTGPERVDKTVETNRGSWDGNPDGFSFQWLRCATDQLTSCVAITGATQSSYTIVADDRNHYVIVKVTASNSAGSAWATSKLGRPIKD